MVESEHVDFPDFDEFCDQLIPLGALISPSELHGLLCGRLCGGMEMDSSQWLTIAWDLLDVVESPSGDVQDQITQIYLATEKALNSGDYDLPLFLPDDDTDMDQRLQALSQWCHGFLEGFGSAGIDPNQEFSSDHADGLRDLAAIVQVGVDEEEDREEEQQELDFTDLVEYVRMAAMSFYEEYGGVTAKTLEPTEKTVH